MLLGKSLLVDIALILALVAIGIVGYKLSPLLMPKVDISVAPDSGCDLQQSACGASLPDGGRLMFALTPRPIPLAAPLEAEVTFTGVDVERVTIDFAGVDMNMGINRQVLQSSGKARFSGRLSLPVCITGRMNWQASLLVESGRRRIAVPFRFTAGH